MEMELESEVEGESCSFECKWMWVRVNDLGSFYTGAGEKRALLVATLYPSQCHSFPTLHRRILLEGCSRSCSKPNRRQWSLPHTSRQSQSQSRARVGVCVSFTLQPNSCQALIYPYPGICSPCMAWLASASVLACVLLLLGGDAQVGAALRVWGGGGGCEHYTNTPLMVSCIQPSQRPLSIPVPLATPPLYSIISPQACPRLPPACLPAPQDTSNVTARVVEVCSRPTWKHWTHVLPGRDLARALSVTGDEERMMRFAGKLVAGQGKVGAGALGLRGGRGSGLRVLGGGRGSGFGV